MATALRLASKNRDTHKRAHAECQSLLKDYKIKPHGGESNTNEQEKVRVFGACTIKLMNNYNSRLNCNYIQKFIEWCMRAGNEFDTIAHDLYAHKFIRRHNQLVHDEWADHDRNLYIAIVRMCNRISDTKSERIRKAVECFMYTGPTTLSLIS